MPLFIIFVFYQIIQLLGAPFIFMYLFFRKFYQKKQAVFTWQRFGFIPAAPLNKKVIWLHAVSVGETLSLEYFITLIKKEIPDSICYITVGTDAAKTLALKNLPTDFISFIPYDFLPCMLIAYYRIKPHALIVVEAEIWPNLLMLASIHKTKIYGLNARVNDRSQKNIILLRHLFTPLLNCFDAIFVQSPTDKQKFQALNIPKEKLIVLGNIKAYNVAIKKTECESTLEKKTFDNKILLAGSIHPGELDYYIEVFTKLKPIYQDLKLILAPRHFTWKAELQKSLSYKKFNFFMWDKENSLPQRQTLNQQLATTFEHHDVLVVSVLGELFKLYRYTDIFFLGGTFVPVGGHNLLEPAAWGVPTLIGPMHWHCKEHANALEQINALIKVNDRSSLIRQTDKLLADTEQINLMGQTASTWLSSEATLVEKNLMELVRFLKKPS
ncbi:hypothetical protein JST56_01325 [Candidatus Dependentiae bacterium]|nr:hypothetical protein [Candidatus Dependentiae bacterium]